MKKKPNYFNICNSLFIVVGLFCVFFFLFSRLSTSPFINWPHKYDINTLYIELNCLHIHERRKKIAAKTTTAHLKKQKKMLWHETTSNISCQFHVSLEYVAIDVVSRKIEFIHIFRVWVCECAVSRARTSDSNCVYPLCACVKIQISLFIYMDI